MILHVVTEANFVIRAVVVFTVFVLCIIALVIGVEIEYKRAVEREKTKQKMALANHENLFEQIEEFRNDFDDASQPRREASR